jgi:hypothetical protein
MDGHIGRLVCTATVLTRAADEGRPAAALAEGLLRAGLPAALPEALERALADDPAVYIARSLHCEVSVGPAVTGAVLARSVAVQIAAAVRDPDHDSTGLVRFPATADYLAALLAALARGDAWQRWYFRPLRRFAEMTPAAVFRALDAEGYDMAHVLRSLYRSGDLSRVTAAVGEHALARSWPSSGPARLRQAEWLSLVRLAAELASVLGWAARSDRDQQVVAAGLARQAGADLDWTDPVGLAQALTQAVWLVASPGPGAETVSARQLPRWLDWADSGTLAAGLSGRPRPGLPAGAQPGSAPVVTRPPRTLAVEAVLAMLISSGAVVLDRTHPVTGSVTLWAALIERMPELAEAPWARDAVTRFVARHLAGPGSAARPGPTATGALTQTGPAPAATGNACAGVYLLLRTLDAIRLPVLCQQAGIPAGALLPRLVWRWAGPDVTADHVAVVLRPLMGDVAMRPGRPAASAWQCLQADVARVVLAQWPRGKGRPRLRAIPFGISAMAAVLGDADDLMWPGGRVRGSADAAGPLLDWWQEVTGEPADRVEQPRGDADDPGRAVLLAALAAVAHAHDGDPEIDLPIDLIALAVLRHWARWLRGFVDAPTPSLLTTFIRRPGHLLATGDGGLQVSLDRRPHDVVLDVSGALDEVSLQWPWRPDGPSPDTATARTGDPGRGPARRIEFTRGS